MLRGILLDRDGVVTKTYPQGDTTRGPRTLLEVDLLPGVKEACWTLCSPPWNFIVVLVTNQPDVARRKLPWDTAEAINGLTRRLAWVHDDLACYHDDADRCLCRKPQPGLLYWAAHKWDLDLTASFMVGDRATDIEAGRRAGCRTVYIGENCPGADHVAPSLLAAVPWICKEATHATGRPAS